jgi:hypothetical protein
MEEAWMESTKRKDAATTTREGHGIKESEMKTDEDDEFDRIERENKITGQPYHFAPQRTWVGLTPEDTFEIGERLGLSDIAWVDLMQAIEAKLKQKNT